MYKSFAYWENGLYFFQTDSRNCPIRNLSFCFLPAREMFPFDTLKNITRYTNFKNMHY